MSLTDYNLPGRVDVTPGQQTWLAQMNANLKAFSMFWPGGYGAVAGEAINTYDIVAFDTTTGTLFKADSNGANGRWNAVGVALNAAGIGQPVKFASVGPTNYIHAQQPGTIFYLSETPGQLTTVAPTTPRIVAMAAPSDVILCAFPSSWKAA